MHAASRDALAKCREKLQGTIGQKSDGGATAATLGSELFQVVEVLDADRSLRIAVADSSAPAAARQDLARSLFGWKVGDATLENVLEAVAQSWSNPRDLRDGLVDLSRLSLLASAAAQGQLPTVEDELFRLGRIVAGNPEFEQALADKQAPADAKRALLGTVLYGKVTAVAETLASQAIVRPESRPAEDLDALSRMAAELQGSSVADVTSAKDLSDEQVESLKARLGKIYGKDMAVHLSVDPTIMGGLVIRVGDEVIDGSVSGRIDTMRRRIP